MDAAASLAVSFSVSLAFAYLWFSAPRAILPGLPIALLPHLLVEMRSFSRRSISARDKRLPSASARSARPQAVTAARAVLILSSRMSLCRKYRTRRDNWADSWLRPARRPAWVLLPKEIPIVRADIPSRVWWVMSQESSGFRTSRTPPSMSARQSENNRWCVPRRVEDYHSANLSSSGRWASAYCQEPSRPCSRR